MGKMVFCPVLRIDSDHENSECMRDQCAWWDARGKCCSIETLTRFAVVSLGFISGAIKSMGGVKKDVKRKEGGGNG